jgi:poly-gamma-glutamate synthesis protein (capsule biosynthesis protein)
MTANPRNAEALAYAGFNVMSFANNHHLDSGYEAFFETLTVLDELNIATCGAGADLAEARRPAVLERNGTKVAVLGYSSILLPGYEAGPNTAGCAPLRIHTYYRQVELEQPGTRPEIVTIPDEDDLRAMQRDVERAKAHSDVVVVTPHWGVHFTPIEVAAYERQLARAAVDAGADLVVGHHQHILKGVDTYRGKAIFHGLGNFVMDAYVAEFADSPGFTVTHARYPSHSVSYRPDYPTYPFHPDARRTGIAQCKLIHGQIAEVSFRPCYINPKGQPEPLVSQDDRFEEVVRYLADISREAGFDTSFRTDGNSVVIE